MTGQGSIAQLMANPEAVRSIPDWSNTFVAFDNEIISTIIIHLPLTQEGLLSVSLPRKKVWLSERLDMTVAVDWDVKPQTKTNYRNQTKIMSLDWLNLDLSYVP